MPTKNTALAALAELEDDETSTKGGTQQCFEHSMAAARQSMGADPSSLDDMHSCEDWPQWDISIKQELDQHE